MLAVLGPSAISSLSSTVAVLDLAKSMNVFRTAGDEFSKNTLILLRHDEFLVGKPENSRYIYICAKARDKGGETFQHFFGRMA